MGGCGRRRRRRRSAIGAELVSNDQVRVRELPPPLQQMLLNLSVGQATPPFGSAERVSVLVLCGRDDPEAATGPTFDQVSLAAQRGAGEPPRAALSARSCGATRWSTIADRPDTPLAVALGDPAGIGA